jgi:hypothetical protein
MNEEDKFYWHKKRQAQGATGLSSRELSVLEAERREHNRLELERIRRQREEREILAAKRAEEKDKIVRERERENLGDWEEKERIFHLSQAYQKVYLRIRENRARNLHLLALPTVRLSIFGLKVDEIFKDSEIILLADENVSGLLAKLDREQIDDALDELEDLFIPYERDERVLKFWKAFKDVANLQRRQVAPKDNRNIALVKDEVSAIFSDKSVHKLLELRQGIVKKLASPNVDTDYWTSLLTELDQVIQKRSLDELYRELKEALKRECETYNFKTVQYSFSQLKHGEAKLVSKAVASSEHESILAGNSNKRSKSSEIEACDNTITNNDISSNHNTDSSIANVNTDNSPAAFHLYEQEQTRHVGKDELPFNAEAEDLLTTNLSPLWAPKFPHIRARKPRFFNRVRMNYVWNKYNQTHYDTSNPPPKVVQGFRFNIFYPELHSSVNTSASSIPNYRREADPTSEDNEIVRFFAGPPYADVVFRIPKEEWDMSSQHGFKCIFERGALRLHFWFRSQRYRR